MALVGFRFHASMIAWIMECVTNTSFSICINGELHGLFKGKRGSKQGDAMSPYFKYASYGDDLFLLAYCNVDSTKVLVDALDNFKEVSGLIQSIPNSMAYFCNVLNHFKLSILSIMPFVEGKLPVKYLGVPLISSRLLYKDCKILLEKVQNRIGDWKNRIWSNLFEHSYSAIGEMKKGQTAMVGGNQFDYPKNEGCLGIGRLEDFNISLTTTHIWSIVTNKELLWVRWIHSYKLMGRSFRDVPPKASMSWGWRKLLQIREMIRPFMWYQLGDGRKLLFGLMNGAMRNTLRTFENKSQVLVVYGTLFGQEVFKFHGSNCFVFAMHFLPCLSFLACHAQKLKTQDRLKQWDVSPNTNLNQCPLCLEQIKRYAYMDQVTLVMANIVTWLQPLSSTRSARVL
ncbi:hypothetical protein Tco_1438924 [Tanacetum coccineum]